MCTLVSHQLVLIKYFTETFLKVARPVLKQIPYKLEQGRCSLSIKNQAVQQNRT